MVIYLDLVFILNGLCDASALYLTARLSGLVVTRQRLILTSSLGGAYSILGCLPLFSFLCSFPGKLLAAVFLVRCAFGKQETFFRIFVLFFILSCSFGGVLLVASQVYLGEGATGDLGQLNWKVFFLVGSISYFLLSVVFRGSAKHLIAGEICHGSITLGAKRVPLDILLDTGHTLYDPYSGSPVLTVWYKVLEQLWTEDECQILSLLDKQGSIYCAEMLGSISPGKFRLIPYRAVGVNGAMLLSFCADEIHINGEYFKSLTVVLSPTPVSDGGGYSALWGGERKGEITACCVE